MSKQPRDDSGSVIPVLGARLHGGHIVPYTTSANTSPSFSGHCLVATLYSTADAFFELGGTANTSNSHFVPAYTVYDISIANDSGTYSNISVIGATASGTLYISERE